MPFGVAVFIMKVILTADIRLLLTGAQEVFVAELHELLF